MLFLPSYPHFDVHQFYHLAGTFSRGFEEAYSALMRLEDSKADNGRIPTIEERLQLSYDIFKIDNTEMARVLTGKSWTRCEGIYLVHCAV